MENDTIISAFETSEGAGARVLRAFPTRLIEDYDPFVLFDEFSLAPNASFPPHPHRGFEALTYMLEGSLRHQDILGNHGEVEALGVQRFTAGRGIVHSEMPGEGSGVSRGLQLWINLPHRLKHADPSYQCISAEEIPAKKVDGGSVRTITGPASPVKILTEMLYIDVCLDPQVFYEAEPVCGWNTFVYVYKGKVDINGQHIERGHAIFFSDHPKLLISAVERCGFVLLSGRPHGEPMYHNGPYVD
ncbi:MAG: pirin family protein [Chitinispirillia bacterium]|nr:pirin family protein [Chitinispirillia bacterium]